MAISGSGGMHGTCHICPARDVDWRKVKCQVYIPQQRIAKQAVSNTVGITELLDITTTSSVAGPPLVGGIKIEVLEGVDDRLLP